MSIYSLLAIQSMSRPSNSFFTPVYTNNYTNSYTNNTNTFFNLFMNLFASFNAPTVAQEPVVVSEPVETSEPTHKTETINWQEYFTNKAPLGQDLVNNNEDKFFSESEGKELVDKDFAIEFFNKMHYGEDINNKFHVDAINTTLNAIGVADSLEQKREKAMLEAIKASDVSNDGIVTRDEFMNAMEAGNGLEIVHTSEPTPKTETINWEEFYTNKAQLGEDLANENEDKFFNESEGTECVDKDFAFEFFNKMQYEKGDNNKFYVFGIDNELKALGETDSLAQKREKAILEAIKAADADNDGIVTTEEFMQKMENANGLVINF